SRPPAVGDVWRHLPDHTPLILNVSSCALGGQRSTRQGRGERGDFGAGSVQEELIYSTKSGRVSPLEGHSSLLDWRVQLDQASQNLLPFDSGKGGSCAEVDTVSEGQSSSGRPG